MCVCVCKCVCVSVCLSLSLCVYRACDVVGAAGFPRGSARICAGVGPQEEGSLFFKKSSQCVPNMYLTF